MRPTLSFLNQSNLELSNDNVELLRHNRQLEETVGAFQNELNLMEKKLRQSSSVQPAPALISEVSPQAMLHDTESTVGPRVLALYEVRFSSEKIRNASRLIF
jgi:hypothetical protein